MAKFHPPLKLLLAPTVHYLLLLFLLFVGVCFALGDFPGVVGGVVFLLLTLSPGRPYSPAFLPNARGGREIPPESAPDLYEMVDELALKAGLPALPRLYLVPHGGVEAFASGSASESVIALSAGLLNNLNYREIRAVLAHEIGHLIREDVGLMGVAGRLARAIALLSYFGFELFILFFGLMILGVVTINPAGWLFLLIAPMAAIHLFFALSREREFLADAKAVELTGDPGALASALTKMDYLAGPWWRKLLFPFLTRPAPTPFDSHPTLRERLERLGV